MELVGFIVIQHFDSPVKCLAIRSFAQLFAPTPGTTCADGLGNLDSSRTTEPWALRFFVGFRPWIFMISMEIKMWTRLYKLEVQVFML